MGCCAKFGGGGGFAAEGLGSVGAIDYSEGSHIPRLLKVLGSQLSCVQVGKSSLTSLCNHRSFLQHGTAFSFVGYWIILRFPVQWCPWWYIGCKISVNFKHTVDPAQALPSLASSESDESASS